MFNLNMLGQLCHYLFLFFYKNKYVNKVDSRVRVQLGPSPVDHEKTPMDKIDGSDLFKFKERICATFHIQYYPHLVFTYHALKS